MSANECQGVQARTTPSLELAGTLSIHVVDVDFFAKPRATFDPRHLHHHADNNAASPGTVPEAGVRAISLRRFLRNRVSNVGGLSANAHQCRSDPAPEVPAK